MPFKPHPTNPDLFVYNPSEYAVTAVTFTRSWQGLTDDEISEVLGSDIHQEQSGELRFIRAIEAKLREKNT